MIRWKLGAKFSLFLVIIFLLGSCLTVFTLSQQLNQQAEDVVKERAELLLTAMQAARNYTQNNIQPILESDTERENDFVQESIPNFAARTIFSDFRDQDSNFQNFSYKEATPNPTNLDDLADSLEVDLFNQLTQLAPESSDEVLSGYRTLEGQKLFYLARPLFMNDVRCLDCHGDPRVAPKSLLKMYGSQNGFGWKLNEVVATQLIYVPADNIFSQGRRNLLSVTKTLAAIFGALFLVINLLLWKTVTQPLEILTKVAKQISSCSLNQQPSHDSQNLEALTMRKDEPGQLARAFQYMVTVLSQREQDLQLAVQERTLSLEEEMHERQTAQEALQTYAHAINHDLRNLAMGISSLVQGLLSYSFTGRYSEGKQNRLEPSVIEIEPEALTMIKKSCDRQLNLMNSLMTAESSNLWQTALKPESVNLRQLAKELQVACDYRLTDSASTLNNQIAADLPNIYADSHQLRRVFENLIDNALKYNPEGITILLHAVVQSDAMIRCTVKDNGVGIDSQRSQMLFGMYARGQGDFQVKGYGLGLYICRKIIEAHGGAIGVEAPVGGGAEFWFTLPCCQ
ncbi:Adaptive-response sensory-kinase SasA [Acaryochloris thomasi RCC1774]|uniref:histidine kinase n=1 Tax=Acaryochloris thomasi RCC1774 TaxID=1764569 RepID=A0A2W1JTX2_9CYAN|nr:DUF3365 domain-containing protein [Acaryochloris thomasi]PZD74495.1 Adaptive-response sensory-kinase SasA [Acaryochloris thomasi RCC1774]